MHNFQKGENVFIPLEVIDVSEQINCSRKESNYRRAGKGKVHQDKSQNGKQPIIEAAFGYKLTSDNQQHNRPQVSYVVMVFKGGGESKKALRQDKAGRAAIARPKTRINFSK